jgi:hypothetical protein
MHNPKQAVTFTNKAHWNLYRHGSLEKMDVVAWISSGATVISGVAQKASPTTLVIDTGTPLFRHISNTRWFASGNGLPFVETTSSQ